MPISFIGMLALPNLPPVKRAFLIRSMMGEGNCAPINPRTVPKAISAFERSISQFVCRSCKNSIESLEQWVDTNSRQRGIWLIPRPDWIPTASSGATKQRSKQKVRCSVAEHSPCGPYILGIREKDRGKIERKTEDGQNETTDVGHFSCGIETEV